MAVTVVGYGGYPPPRDSPVRVDTSWEARAGGAPRGGARGEGSEPGAPAVSPRPSWRGGAGEASWGAPQGPGAAGGRRWPAGEEGGPGSRSDSVTGAVGFRVEAGGGGGGGPRRGSVAPRWLRGALQASRTGSETGTEDDTREADAFTKRDLQYISPC